MPSGRDIIFRCQFNTGAIVDNGLILEKGELDDALRGNQSHTIIYTGGGEGRKWTNYSWRRVNWMALLEVTNHIKYHRQGWGRVDSALILEKGELDGALRGSQSHTIA